MEIIRETIELAFKDDVFYLPVQGDVENISDAMLGNHENIYFSPIPLTSHLYLVYNKEVRGWEITHKELDKCPECEFEKLKRKVKYKNE